MIKDKKMNSFEMVSNAIAKKLEIDVATIKPESTLEELGLDSLDTFDIIFEAEDKLGIKVPNDQVDVKTIQDMTNLLDQLLAKKV
jgi:acyl carrier protein